MKFELRQGTVSDEEWLYNLYCLTMRAHIEKTWGWDEAFQRNGFKTNLHPTKFKIVIVSKNDVGAYQLNEKCDYCWLEMVLISPNMQRRGLGTEILKKLQKDSGKRNKPLKLSVIKANPAKKFYSHLDFHVYDEDGSFFKMEWTHSRQG